MGKTIYLINTLQNLQAFFSLTPFLILIGLPITMFLVSMYNDGVEPRKEIDFFCSIKEKIKIDNNDISDKRHRSRIHSQ